jgi:Txe/YoeB family toxin of Txe-Axe toxin-antitoxin module
VGPVEDQCKNCPFHADFDRRLTRNEDDIKALYDRTNEHAKTIERVLALLEGVSKDVAEIKAKVETLSARPGNMWDKVVFALISAGAGAFIAFVVK